MTTSTIDILMQRIEEINAKEPPLSAEDIASLVEYHRASRARKAAGEKPSKPKIDLNALLGLSGKVAPKACVTPSNVPPSVASTGLVRRKL